MSYVSGYIRNGYGGLGYAGIQPGFAGFSVFLISPFYPVHFPNGILALPALPAFPIYAYLSHRIQRPIPFPGLLQLSVVLPHKNPSPFLFHLNRADTLSRLLYVRSQLDWSSRDRYTQNLLPQKGQAVAVYQEIYALMPGYLSFHPLIPLG